MAKNHNKKPNIKTVTVPEIEYKFVLAQNELLKKQNRELQCVLNGKDTGFIGIINSLGKNILSNYVGGKNDKEI